MARARSRWLTPSYASTWIHHHYCSQFRGVEAEYERFFGRSGLQKRIIINLKKGILDNGVRLYSRHREVVTMRGHQHAEPPIGIGMVYSRCATTARKPGACHQPFLELVGRGHALSSLQNIAYKAPH